jgi:putative transposase
MWYSVAMPRPKRICPAGEVFHVLNRGVARLSLFEKPEDYDAFLRALDTVWEEIPLPIFALVLMPNHWHFVVKGWKKGQDSFLRVLNVGKEKHCHG